jgi:hypothetical protein
LKLAFGPVENPNLELTGTETQEAKYIYLEMIYTEKGKSIIHRKIWGQLNHQNKQWRSHTSLMRSGPNIKQNNQLNYSNPNDLENIFIVPTRL